jgi:hypothetical protein
VSTLLNRPIRFAYDCNEYKDYEYLLFLHRVHFPPVVLVQLLDKLHTLDVDVDTNLQSWLAKHDSKQFPMLIFFSISSNLTSLSSLLHPPHPSPKHSFSNLVSLWTTKVQKVLYSLNMLLHHSIPKNKISRS